MKPTKEQIQSIGKETRFTEKEIKEYFKFADGPRLDRSKFRGFAENAGIKNPKLHERLWDLFDTDDDGTVAVEEFIISLSKLLRGDISDVSRYFFELYDINHDGQLNKKEVIDIARLFWSEIHQDEDFTEDQIKRITEFLENADQDKDTVLQVDEFENAIRTRLGRLRKLITSF